MKYELSAFGGKARVLPRKDPAIFIFILPFSVSMKGRLHASTLFMRSGEVPDINISYMSYSIQSHTITFENDYTVLVVKEGTTQVLSIALDDPDIIASVSVENGNYVITTNGPWGGLPHKYDTDGNQTTLAFSGSKMGGIGLVDLRDCGKSGNYEVEYNLACDGVSLRMLSGPKPFQVFPHNTDCYTHTAQ